MIIFMDPPEHRNMRSLLNKVFTPRAIQAQKQMVDRMVEQVHQPADPDGFDVVQEFSGPFPVEVITTMLGVPEDRQQVRHWIDKGCIASSARSSSSEKGMQANIDNAMFYLELVQKRRANPQDDMFSQADRSRARATRTADCASSTISRSRHSQRFSAAQARRRSPSWSATRCTCSPSNPDQWQKLQDDRSRIPAAVEELLRYEAPSQYNVRRNMKDVHLHGTTIPEGSPVFLIGGSAQPRRRAWTDADTFDIDRDRTEAQNLGLGYGIHSCLGAALARMESAIALEKLLDFMPRYEVDFDDCRRVQMQNVVGWQNVP